MPILLGDSKNLRNVWPETGQNLKQLSKIKGASLKFKNHKRFTLRPRYSTSIQPKKRPKNLM
jgi:hypothetical protein